MFSDQICRLVCEILPAVQNGTSLGALVLNVDTPFCSLTLIHSKRRPMKTRCPWAEKSPLEQAYHDMEWGVPVHDDQRLFEFLVLEGSQAGLSWSTILRKREGYRRALDGFNPDLVAFYDERKMAELMATPDIVRNRLKIEAAVRNAKAVVQVQKEFGSFDAYIWRFVNGTTIQYARRCMEEIPASTPLSESMSKELKKRGFSFVGTTICYAFMQAVGMVNDHTIDCFRWKELGGGTAGTVDH